MLVTCVCLDDKTFEAHLDDQAKKRNSWGEHCSDIEFTMAIVGQQWFGDPPAPIRVISRHNSALEKILEGNAIINYNLR